MVGAGRVVGERLVAAPGRRQDRLHRLDRGRAGASAQLASRSRSSASRSSSAASRRTSSSRTPTSRRPPPRRPSPCSATPARTAARARGSSSSESALDRFLQAARDSRQGAPGRRPARRQDRDGPADLGRSAREGRVLPRRRSRGRDPRQRAGRRRATGSRRPCSAPVANTDRAAREEIFGPIAVVIPFEDEEEAIRIANDTIYGLSGSIWTEQRRRARCASRVRSRPARSRSTRTARSA